MIGELPHAITITYMHLTHPHYSGLLLSDYLITHIINRSTQRGSREVASTLSDKSEMFDVVHHTPTLLVTVVSQLYVLLVQVHPRKVLLFFRIHLSWSLILFVSDRIPVQLLEELVPLDFVDIFDSQPLADISLHKFGDKPSNFERHMRWEPQFASLDILKQLVHAVVKERRLSHHHLVQHTSQPIYITRKTNTLLL